jgi:flagellar biosynthesis protein FliP
MKAIALLFLFIIGMGVALGALVSNSELLRPQETSFNTYVATEKFRLEHQRAQDQLLYERQQQAQALENQRARGAALAQVIQQGGPILIYALAFAIVILTAGYTYQIVVHSMLALRDDKAPRPAGPARAVPKSPAPEPLRFPDLKTTQRMRKGA